MGAIVTSYPARAPAETIPDPDPDTAGLIRAGVSFRSGGAKLDGLTISETRYVFLSAGSSGAASVRWFLDGTEVRTDDAAPFDFEGETVTGDPLPLRLLADGTHTISALYTKPDTTVFHVEAEFDVDGSTGPPPPPPPPPPVSGVKAGVAVHDQANVTAVETQMGHALPYRLNFVGWRGLNWTQWVNDVDRALSDNDWLNGSWTLLLSVPPLPDEAKVTGLSLANGAAGAYNTYWDQVGDLLAALSTARLSRLIICLFREHNANWYPWRTEPTGATQAQKEALCADMVAYWRVIVGRIRAKVGPAKAAVLKFEWTPNGPPANTTARAALIKLCYPGDAYVDVIGFDYYTNLDSLKAGFPSAWKFFADLAVEHNKVVGLTETSTGSYIEMAPGHSWKSGWAAGTVYTYNASSVPIVYNDDRFWRAVASSTGVEPGSDASKWVEAYLHRGTYNAGTTYTKSDIVVYQDIDWRCDMTGTVGVTPADNAQWTPAFSGPGDYPQYATDLANGMTYAFGKGALHHASLWEFDVPRERLWASVVAQKKPLPGRETWRVGRLDVTTTSGSPTLTAAAREDYFDASDIGQTVTAPSGISGGTTITAVAADGKTATMSANASATGARTIAVGGIPNPDGYSNYPRTARRLIRLLGGS